MLALACLAILAYAQPPEAADLLDLLPEAGAVSQIEIEEALADRSRSRRDLLLLAELVRERNDRLFQHDRAQAIAVLLRLSASRSIDPGGERGDVAGWIGINVAFDLLFLGGRAGSPRPPLSARTRDRRCRSLALDSLKRGHAASDEAPDVGLDDGARPSAAREALEPAPSRRAVLLRKQRARAVLRARSALERGRALECPGAEPAGAQTTGEEAGVR